MSRLLVVGAGGHGKVVAEAAELLGRWDSIEFADDKFPALSQIGKWPVVSNTNPVSLTKLGFKEFTVAIGNNLTRLQVQQKLVDGSFIPVTIIHPAAVVSPSVKIGVGSVIFAGAVINADTVIGDACIINTSASIDHDCEFGDSVHISPGAHLAGEVSVGKGSWLGIGSSVIQCISIGENVLVGAGAAVVSDIPGGVTAKGVPARF